MGCGGARGRVKCRAGALQREAYLVGVEAWRRAGFSSDLLIFKRNCAVDVLFLTRAFCAGVNAPPLSCRRHRCHRPPPAPLTTAAQRTTAGRMALAASCAAGPPTTCAWARRP